MIDTAWWLPADLIAMFALAPPGNVVWASDSPYGWPLPSAVMALRCALQAGLVSEQVRAVAGGQLERVLAGEGRRRPRPGAGRSAGAAGEPARGARGRAT